MPESQINFPRPKVAISDCLMGVECRYNGGHAQYDFVRNELAEYVDYKRFCPEAAVMGTPRETIRLVGTEAGIRVVGPKSGNDYTDGLQEYNDKKVAFMVKENIDGAVVKSRSPSCGLERIKVYQPTGEWYGSKDPLDMGRFTKTLRDALPTIAIEEEGRLQDAWLRENFIMHLFSAARWREFVESEPSLAQLQAFHRDHKYLLMSKHDATFRELGSIVAQARKETLSEALSEYQVKFLDIMQQRSTRGRMINAMDHMYGYFKDQVNEAEKQHYLETVEEFRLGIVPMISVMKVLEQFIHHYGNDYLATQVVLHPYPAKLALRSKIGAYR